ncbi:hypothetical protein L226DRAFT_611763 [Lentinus tigrinus ALCF2SS1-7]|uniref:uncharacterized protein n=1 Tax=Lentinus tigrinus ALCF2SS1-7 TaxID=1328758 RepID=UPI0011661933|nr:hypothetical protein L226DRAFT_611763 [Lentinus tigrinus ALCF2SS1-7]
MSPRNRATPFPGPSAYYAANVYMPDVSPTASPKVLPCQRIGWTEADSYTLSSDQVSRIVTGIREFPSPPQSSSGGSERNLATYAGQPRRRYPPFGPESPLDPALRQMFPSIRETVLEAVTKHQLDEDEFHKLASDPTRRKGRVAFDRYDQGVRCPREHHRRLPDSAKPLYDLLQLADGSHQYLSQLVAFEGKYEWAAVLAYHFDFYRAQVREMKRGNYAGWAQVTVNAALHVRHLAGREKGYAAARTPSVAGLHKMDNSSDEGLAREGELCDLFNPGVCASPCRYRRIHQCQGCGSYEHPIGACPRVVVYSTQRPMHA